MEFWVAIGTGLFALATFALAGNHRQLYGRKFPDRKTRTRPFLTRAVIEYARRRVLLRYERRHYCPRIRDDAVLPRTWAWSSPLRRCRNMPRGFLFARVLIRPTELRETPNLPARPSQPVS